MAPFYGWGSTASRLEPLRGGSLLFTTKFPEVPGTNGECNQSWLRRLAKKANAKMILSYYDIKVSYDDKLLKQTYSVCIIW